MRRSLRLVGHLALYVTLIGGISLAGAADSQLYTEGIYLFPANPEVEGAFEQAPQVPEAEATLDVTPDSATVWFVTRDLPPGHAVTLWWVIFNNPSMCSDGVCGEDDVLPPPGNTKAGVSLGYADGWTVDANGRAVLFDRREVNDMSGIEFGPGLTHPLRAEIHLVLRSHGPVIPGRLGEQISTLLGGCDPEPPHQPCQDLQFAIFQQGEKIGPSSAEPAPPTEGYTIHVDAREHVASQPELIVHHWCKPLPSGTVQCLLYDSDDPDARLIGTETVVSAELYQAFSESEKADWHYHKEEIPAVDATFPDLSQAEAQELTTALEETYGKVVIFWDPADPAPIGAPVVTRIHAASEQ